jgi:mannonate dehydratase
MEQGFRYLRVQVGIPGLSTYGSRGGEVMKALNPAQDHTWEPTPYVRTVPKLLEHIRVKLGDEIELLHDVHERIPPIQGVWLAKAVEPYRLFFLEDLFAPEDNEYFRMVRQQCSTPIAMGELFVNQAEYVPLIKDRLIDFIRVHISDIGGLSMARKLAAFCEFMGVRTAWHGPGDVSPVGHAANVHLDLACTNFGIQEATIFRPETQEVFPGCPAVRDGCYWINEAPGLGIDINEALAAKFPFPEHKYNGAWPEVRRLDGTVVKP